MAGTWTCSEDEDFGSLGDNKVICTGGGAPGVGTPLYLSDFVAADRAGYSVLMAATAVDADPKSFSLTYQPRPVEDRAIRLRITMSADKGGATLDIDGDDWKGSHQDDDGIDISGAATTPVVTTTYWSAIDASGITVNGISDSTTIKVEQEYWGFIWDYGNGQYFIECDEWDIGDNSTATHLESTQEMVFYDADLPPKVRHNATHYIGKADGDWSIEGSYWSLGTTAFGMWQDWTASSVQIYGSLIENRNNDIIRHRFGTSGDGLIIKNSIICGRLPGSSSNCFDYNLPDYIIKDVYMNNMYYGVTSAVAPDAASVMDDVHIHNCTVGLNSNDAGAGEVEASNTRFSEIIQYSTRTAAAGSGIVSIDPADADVGTIYHNQLTNFTTVKFTCNIKVVDVNGDALPDTTTVTSTYDHLVEGSDSKTYRCIQNHTSVDATHKPITGSSWSDYWELVDEAGDLDGEGGDWETTVDYKTDEQSFSVTTTSGSIAEQELLHTHHTGFTAANKITRVHVHKFTFSEAGYKTHIIENLILDAPIVWHVELQPLDYPTDGMRHNV